jgi:lipopolysaccharide transport system ATP-binding protein
VSNEVAIRVERLSKAYRIGLAEQRHETLMGAVASFVKSPWQNYRNLRKLSRFDDVKAEDGRSKMEDRGPIASLPSANSHLPSSGAASPSPISHLPSPGASAASPSTLSHLPTPISSSPSDVIWALKDVSFEVKHGEVLGIIGRNGAGKSTLLKILSRITEPTSGRATIYGRVGSLLEVGTGFHPDLTGRENTYLNGTILGMRKNEVDRKFDEIVDFSGVEKFIDTPVKRYSSGMRVRLAFAVAAHLDPEILIIDEVLAVGDLAFQKTCLGKMRDVARQGRTVLFVSHNMGAVANLCGRGLLLENGNLEFEGTASEAIQHYNHLASNGQVGAMDRPAHIVYREIESQAHASQCWITEIEVLDSKGDPMPIVTTWDSLVLRIHYSSTSIIRRGSVAVRVSTPDGSPILLLSTEPDGRFPLDIELGEHAVECYLETLPLAAGTYRMGAGLALPNAQWLWWQADLCSFTVLPRDVYGSGSAPSSHRALIAVKHKWRKPT